MASHANHQHMDYSEASSSSHEGGTPPSPPLPPPFARLLIPSLGDITPPPDSPERKYSHSRSAHSSITVLKKESSFDPTPEEPPKMAPVSHATLGFVSIIFLSGAIVMMFFVVLAGVSSTTPLKDTYFLQANTEGITGAKAISQWTYLYVCGPGNADCGSATPAMPFGYAWASGAANAPAELIGDQGNGTTSTKFFYMWRFGWVFYLIALFFTVLAWFTGFLACCGRLGAAVSGLVTVFALFFHTIAVSLMTATFVKARDAFIAANRDASLGKYAFGFSWGAWAALFIAVVLFCVGTRGNKGETSGRRTRSRWGRQRSTRSRRSYDINRTGSRRVKDDYS